MQLLAGKFVSYLRQISGFILIRPLLELVATV
jgi:hypothetical protein